ncbi:hypothetical protein ACQR1H_19010 [Bradyrhizobium sp. HKCCYLRH2015]|uniref:hypothetical protein n=1 Tax=Bradyrhizobium sp. HKCCYLRH2015 TaxID=3420742 RepID=UPI003EB9CFAA
MLVVWPTTCAALLLRSYPYKRSALVALRETAISTTHPASIWWPGDDDSMLEQLGILAKSALAWVRLSWNRLRWRFISRSPIASVPWSAIRRVGQSKLLSLTIVVPFLGSLLLFNQHIVDLLTLSPDLVRHWFKLPLAASEGAARQLTISRLYFTYFGLTFLGFGSALFTLFCPQLVKQYASPLECVQAETSLVTRSRIVLIVSDVANAYLQWVDDDPLARSIIQRIGRPNDFIDLCSVALVEVFSDMPPEQFGEEPPAEPTAQPDEPTAPPNEQIEQDGPFGLTTDYDDDPFYDHRGQPAPDKIAATLLSGRRLLQWFVTGFNEVAGSEKHRNDMLALQYMAMDNSKPLLRVMVAIFYGLGFVILTVPTISTFVQITWRLIR